MITLLEFKDTTKLEDYINKEGILESFSIEDIEFYLEDKSRTNYSYLNTDKDESVIIEIDNREQNFYVSHEFIY
jgi:hypothetical protein